METLQVNIPADTAIVNNTKFEFTMPEPETNPKVVLGFCRGSETIKYKKRSSFYFHVAEMNWLVRDFPDSVLEADLLFLYSGGRSKARKFTGHYAKIKSVQIKHKSRIKGKENSNTEYYGEIKVLGCFKKNKKLKSVIEPNLFFNEANPKEIKFFREHLPASTTLDKILESNGISRLT